ncbi:MAG: 6-phosphogluconolactonase [Oceanospirillaceae bacterium]|nr:6-phosphogluconolactonase [Oceanospirillaceae bacterium]MBT10943.1 6-phosphogluconolactonase [Oceanospirillaceae bacterium]|tara:strand:+ start:3397 stop:4098 length:702 start_codon:yes stop_codon:yes gene_type:complete
MQDSRFPDSHKLARQLAEDLAERMRDAIAERGRVCIAVSGGNTPVAFFKALSDQSLPWDKVLVTLVDERWVNDDEEGSNARLVKDNLLINQAADAYFLPLKNTAPTPVDGFMECENRLHELIVRLDYAVLGMGTDGHTASWFPQSQALARALDEAGGAWCCPVTDAPSFPQRMTLTWSFLAGCRHLFLHFEGQEKDEVFTRVTDPAQIQNLTAMPVRTILSQSAVPLSLYRTA